MPRDITCTSGLTICGGIQARASRCNTVFCAQPLLRPRQIGLAIARDPRRRVSFGAAALLRRIFARPLLLQPSSGFPRFPTQNLTAAVFYQGFSTPPACRVVHVLFAQQVMLLQEIS
eukprot:5016224-Amphidinium_carterae.1